MKRATRVITATVLLALALATTPPAARAGTVTGKTVVATTRHRGFFGLKAFEGRLYAGTYGLGGVCEIHRGREPHRKRMRPFRDSQGEIISFRVGESIYELEEFNGHLYASTENVGKILRFKPGRGWRKVGVIGGKAFSLAVYDDKLYAGNSNGRVFRSVAGRFRDVDPIAVLRSDLRELIVFRGRLYALGYDYVGDRAAIHVFNGTGWREIRFDALRNERIMKAHVWNDRLWFSSSPWVNGQRKAPARVWRWDGTADPAGLENVFNDPNRQIGMDLLDFNGRLYFSTIEKWHYQVEAGAALHRSDLGGETWDEPDAYEFRVFKQHPEAWSLEVFQGNLYVTTSYRSGGDGKVYGIFTEEVCDGFDNNGDGEVDEGLSCPD